VKSTFCAAQQRQYMDKPIDLVATMLPMS